MTILSLSRFMLAGVLLASFNASAIPGFWQQGYGQGNTEYSVTEASGKTFTINCTGTRTRMVSISIQYFLPLPMTRWSVRTMTTLLSP